MNHYILDLTGWIDQGQVSSTQSHVQFGENEIEWLLNDLLTVYNLERNRNDCVFKPNNTSLNKPPSHIQIFDLKNDVIIPKGSNWNFIGITKRPSCGCCNTFPRSSNDQI